MAERKICGAAVRTFESKYDNYDPKVGDALVAEAERIGNPLEYVKAEFCIDTNTISCWLGNLGDGRYKQDHFVQCYNTFLSKRRDWLDKQAITGSIAKDLWACLCWSNLKSKVNPPREVTCEADVKTTMKVEDMNEIIQKLESKKSSVGF